MCWWTDESLTAAIKCVVVLRKCLAQQPNAHVTFLQLQDKQMAINYPPFCTVVVGIDSDLTRLHLKER